MRMRAFAGVAVLVFVVGCNSSSIVGGGGDAGPAKSILIGPPSGPTTESGGQATFTVVLNRRPGADVTVSFGSTDASEAVVGVTSVTFTNVNWDAPQTVTVTGVDDPEADGLVPFEIEFLQTTSNDDDYAAITPASVPFANVDDDSAGVIASPVSGATSESGEQASFSVVLTSQPLGNVGVALDSSDPSEGTVGVASLTFTPANWNAPQSVSLSGVDDPLADGNQVFDVSFQISSTDPDYAGLPVGAVHVTNVDDDSAGVTVSAISGATTEAGGAATFSVKLNAQPSANVTTTISSSDSGEGTASGTLTFTNANWNAPQTVTVSGVDDDLADGNQPYTVTFTALSSGDPAYSGMALAPVPVTNVDDDSAGISVSAASGPTTEAAGTATFTIVLTSQPTASVSLSFASNALDEGTLSTGSAVFTTTDWSTPRTVTVTGVDDAMADGNQPYAITFSTPTTTDVAYAAITPANVSLTNVDDDTAGILVSPPSGPTTEAAGTATFTVRLTAQPAASVTVNVTSNAVDEGTLSATSLTFTATDWMNTQTITVTGVDDDLDDGDQPYAAVFGATSSADGAYAALTPPNVALTNVDDDAVGFVVTPSMPSTSEAGANTDFSIRLTSEPTSDVTVSFASSDATEGFPGGSVTFTPANWMTAQNVPVSGVDDDVDDGDQPYSIVSNGTTSLDTAYAAIAPPAVALVNIDDDTAGIVVSPSSGPTTEAGGTATFTVVLTSQPTSNVTVGFASSDATEGTPSATSLLFTGANWNLTQTVTVTGVDDADLDGDVTYRIDFSGTASGDAAYAAITPASVGMINLDDETAGGGSETCPDGVWSAGPDLLAGRHNAHVAGVNGRVFVIGGWNGTDTTTNQILDTTTGVWSLGASMPAGRYGGEAAEIDGKIYVVGGWTTSPGLPHSELYRYDPVANTWSTLASMPTLNACGVAGAINGKLYVTTACNGSSGYRNFLHVYDPATNGWTALANSPTAHGSGAGGVIGGKLYVAGGVDSSDLYGATMHVYDPATNVWTAKASLPRALVNMASAVIDGKLFLFGGNDGVVNRSEAYSYDPATNVWSQVAPLSFARQVAASATVDGNVWLAGGATSTQNAIRTVESYRPCRGGTWVTKAPMLARSAPVAAPINGKLYVAGGSNGGATATLQIYDPSTNAWASGLDMPGPRYQSAVAEIGGKMYVAGGWTTSPGLPNSNLWRYDPTTNAWTTLTSMPTLSACGVAGAINGKLYVTTGCNGFSGYASLLHVYDPATNAWTPLASSPNAHGAMPAGGVIGGKLYVAGGADSAGNMQSKVDVYDPATNTWSTLADMPAARLGVAGAVVNGMLYAFGGYTGTTPFENRVDVYDPATNTWRNAPAMPTRRLAHAAANLDGTVYVVGGEDGPPLATVEAYLP